MVSQDPMKYSALLVVLDWMQLTETAPSRSLQTVANSTEMKEIGGVSWATNIFNKISWPSLTCSLSKYKRAFVTPERVEAPPLKWVAFRDQGAIRVR